jgi:hypothetical protein
VGLGEVIFLGGWGLSQGVVFQARKVGVFFVFQGIISLVVWDGGVGEKGGYIYLFFFSFIIW